MDKILLNSESYDILVQGNFENNFKIIQKNKNGFEIEVLKYPLYFLFHSEKQDKIRVYIRKNKVIDICSLVEYLKFSNEYPEIEKMISEFSTYISKIIFIPTPRLPMPVFQCFPPSKIIKYLCN